MPFSEYGLRLGKALAFSVLGWKLAADVLAACQNWPGSGACLPKPTDGWQSGLLKIHIQELMETGRGGQQGPKQAPRKGMFLF